MKYQCAECQTFYSKLSNLRKHARKFHPKDVTKLAPLQYNKCPSNSDNNNNIQCRICDKTFIHKNSLNRHLKKLHDLNPSLTEIKTTKLHKKCALCEYRVFDKENLMRHYESVHEIHMNWQQLKFPTMDEFNQWKMEMENKTFSKFVKKSTTSSKLHTFIQYTCHRSGTYIPEGKGLRHLKTQGSNKINAYCPANIQVFIENDNNLSVKYLETHVGHKLDIGHLTLTEMERKNIASKIALKIPFDVILDEIRDSITDDTLERIHLTTRKDLFNIEASFNLCSSSVRHSSDAISVESWVIEMQRIGKHILFYKPQGASLEDYPLLRKEDFVLIIMTQAQLEMLKKYGSDCVCLDGTHGLNSYNFELHTLLVIDDMREGFPCAFLFSNRADTYIINLFLTEIAKEVGIITPRTFMSDLTEIYFNAWLEVMGMPENRFFCTWHVDRAWRKNLSKIKNQENRIVIYKQLRTLLQERDQVAFERMLEQFCTIVNDEVVDFINYFKENYQKNSKYWAYCYRQHSGLNTNMHLERMHKTIKYYYLAGKKVKRLDKGITALMKFVRDKLVDRLIVINKGKISHKLKIIRNRHKNQQLLDTSLIVHTDHGWEILSASTNEIYLIQEGNNSCSCQLRCTECNICIHSYYCTCQDSSIQFNVCKHIHLLAQFRKINENAPSDVPNKVPPEVGELYIDSDEDDSNVIITQLSKKQKVTTSMQDRKKNLLQQCNDIVTSCDSQEKLDAVQKVLNSLTPVLAAIDHNNQSKENFLPSDKSIIPHNKKIIPQRKFWSTKKKSKKPSLSIKKPSADESNSIAIQILSNMNK